MIRALSVESSLLDVIQTSQTLLKDLWPFSNRFVAVCYGAMLWTTALKIPLKGYRRGFPDCSIVICSVGEQKRYLTAISERLQRSTDSLPL